MLCYIGIGSNLGDRLKYIQESIRFLKKTPGVRVKKISPVYETRPFPARARQRDYLNLVAAVETRLPASQLLGILKEVEKAVGRKVRSRRWSSREIDLDILLYGRKIVRGRNLAIPHPRLRQRYFALKPLSDLASRLRVPGTGERVKDLLRMFDSEKEGRKIEETL